MVLNKPKLRSFKIFLLDLKVYWRSIVLIFVPLILLPLPVIHSEYSEARCAYVVLIMAIFWMLEILPLGVTAFLPIFMFPLLNVLSVNDTCQNYLKGTNFLFFGGLMVAVAVEDSKLHKRIALRVLLAMGSKPEWLMCGFMLVTAFLSMWISNTATTAMMLPIATAVILELQREDEYMKTTLNSSNPPPTAGTSINNINQPVKVSSLYKKICHYTQRYQCRPFCEHFSRHLSESIIWRTQLLFWSEMLSINGSVPAVKRDPDTNIDVTEPDDKDEVIKPNGIAKGLLLCICYSANIGGSGTLTGTGPNLDLKGNLDVIFPGEDTGVNYASWMALAIPPICVKLVICWAVLQLLFFPKQSVFSRCRRRPMTFAEGSVLFWFIMLILLWIFRAPGFMPGWVDLMGIESKMISDSSSAMLIACILFAWPSKRPQFFCCPNRDRSVPAVSSPGLLTWRSMAAKLPWSVLMLLGGSFAMAHGIKASKLSNWIGCSLRDSLQGLDAFTISAVFTILITFITELTSNTATASVFTPIMISLGLSLHENPLKFAFPATLTSSYAFMLPVATPPNAIVYETGVITIRNMMWSGFFLNWLCIGVTLTNMRTWSRVVFNLDEFPSWAGGANSTYCA